MATYYVRISGNDANTGTSPAQAWRTIGKALSSYASSNFNGGSSTTLTVSGFSLTASAWVGATITILTGTGSGSTGIVTANTTSQFTVASWSGTAPSGTGTFQITYVTSGDVVYIGAGTYREYTGSSAIATTSEIRLVGDVTGAYTGDAGEVIWSAYTNGDHATAANSNISVGGRKYLTFENLTFITGAFTYSGIEAEYNALATNITVRNCTFLQSTHGGSIMIRVVVGNNAPAVWRIENCRFFGNGSSTIAVYAGDSATGSGYDIDFVISNCVFYSLQNSYAISVYSGGQASRPGGMTITNCTFIGGGVLSATNWSTTNPAVFKNCLGFNSQNITAGTVGMIADGGGNRFVNMGTTSSLSNVTAHPTSRYGALPVVHPLEIGQSALLGMPYRHPLQPYAASGSYPRGALGLGNVSGGTTTDILGAARPSGSAVYYDTGTATSGTTSTLVDTTKNWPTSYLVGWKIRIVAGLGSGQVKTIRTNSATSVTISGGAPAGGNWAVTPDATSQYVIYQGPMVETGKATSGSTTTLVDSNANWAVGQWAGYSCEFDNQVATVASNTATTLTFSATVTAPTATSTYSLYFPGSSLTANLPAAGAFEGSNTGKIDTSTYAP